MSWRTELLISYYIVSAQSFWTFVFNKLSKTKTFHSHSSSLPHIIYLWRNIGGVKYEFIPLMLLRSNLRCVPLQLHCVITLDEEEGVISWLWSRIRISPCYQLADGQEGGGVKAFSFRGAGYIAFISRCLGDLRAGGVEKQNRPVICVHFAAMTHVTALCPFQSYHGPLQCDQGINTPISLTLSAAAGSGRGDIRCSTSGWVTPPS